MEKYNYLIDNVFMGLVMDKTPERFLDLDEKLNIEETPEITRMKTVYKDMVEEMRIKLEELALIEEAITFLRSAEVSKTQIKLSNVRGYIYARTPLFRTLSRNRDYRTVVGRVSEYGDDLEALKNNEQFMGQAMNKLQAVLTLEINSILSRARELEEKFQD